MPPGALRRLKALITNTHRNKTYYFYPFPRFVGEVSLGDSLDVQDKHRSTDQTRDMISFFFIRLYVEFHENSK